MTKKTTKKKAGKRVRKEPVQTVVEGQQYPWNIHRVPRRLKVDNRAIPHPGRSSAIFVVHGIGEQGWTETAAGLRSGFEDALEAIKEWQQAHKVQPRPVSGKYPIPPPFVYGGFWANYTDLEKTFPEDWKRFNERERKFFKYLWELRAFSITRTYLWFIKQQLSLLSPKVLKQVGLRSWLLYLPLQIVSFVVLTFALIRHPKLITGFLADIRLYLDPEGLVEKAIVHRIDERVGQAFCQMIGLDLNFRRLTDKELIQASGEQITFERVIWVAHSLGTVISYNVLSDLFRRARRLEGSGDKDQKEGVMRFRKALRRFVTMGSPLDKVAFLFGQQSLRPWPKGARTGFLEGGETLKEQQPPESREWWINFYHVLDPVSGSLENELICGDKAPANFHIRSGLIPGLAHVAYWKDLRTLRFILGRTYGKAYLPDQEFVPWSTEFLTVLALLAYCIWAAALVFAVYAIVRWGPDVIDSMLAELTAFFGT